MKSQARWSSLAMVVIGIHVLALVVIGTWFLGCGQKRTESQTTPQTAQQASGEAAEHGESGETIKPAGTVPEIWAQIIAEREKLSAAIQNGQLKDVHHHAFGIRDLVAALAEKASVSSPGTAPKLNGLV